MIFVTVGTHHQGFERLVQAADELAAHTAETVLVQRGVCDFQPQHARHFDFTSPAEMEAWMAQARVVVAQAGAGTILAALKLGKPVVVTPRMKAWGENYTDHQTELADVLSKAGQVIQVRELSGSALAEAVSQAGKLHPPVRGASGLVPALRSQLEAWQPQAAATAARLEKLNRRLEVHRFLWPLLPFLAAAGAVRAAGFWLRGQRRDAYGIKALYLPRKQAALFDDTHNTDHFQDQVYQRAHEFATHQGLKRILDVGCGSAYKLLKYFGEDETLGLELPETLAFLQNKYPQRRWALADFAHPPAQAFDLGLAIDVIEHVADPHALLGFLQQLNCPYFLLSTPERSRMGVWSGFRPRNRCHVREWSQDEFVEYAGRYFQVVETGVLGQHDQYVIVRKR